MPTFIRSNAVQLALTIKKCWLYSCGAKPGRWAGSGGNKYVYNAESQEQDSKMFNSQVRRNTLPIWVWLISGLGICSFALVEKEWREWIALVSLYLKSDKSNSLLALFTKEQQKRFALLLFLKERQEQNEWIALFTFSDTRAIWSLWKNIEKPKSEFPNLINLCLDLSLFPIVQPARGSPPPSGAGRRS